MSFFPLSYRCDIKKRVTTADRSGQDNTTSYEDISLNVKCLFLSTSGNKRAIAGEVFESVMAFYVEPSVPIEEGHLIFNIRDKSGTVIEEGPFETLSVKKTPGLGGKIHHNSCKLKGLG